MKPSSFPLAPKPVWCVVAALCGIALAPVALAAPAVPDPCKLVTASELAQIVGPLKGSPKPGDIAAGDVSCAYTPAAGPAWIEIRLQDGPLSYWRSRNGGSQAVSLPELGKDAFATPDADGSAALYVKKGDIVLRVSLPREPSAIDKLKAIALKALPRL
jgi:hypothetical protein